MTRPMVVAALVCLLSGLAFGDESALVGFPSTGSVQVTREGAAYLLFDSVGFGAGWSWFDFRGSMAAEGGATVQHLRGRDKKQPGAELSLDIVTRRTGPRQLTCTYDLSTTQDVNLVYVVVSIEAGKMFDGTPVRARRADGSADRQTLPPGFQGLGKAVQEVAFTDAEGRATRVSFDPPVDIASDQALRAVLAAGRFRAPEPRRVTMTVDLPEELTYYASLQDVPGPPGIEDWYPFQPKNDYDVSSAIGMEDWADAPAGARGRVVQRGDRLLYGGEPIKLWGMNLQFAQCAPDRALAEKHARMYRKFGVNTMRLHKCADGPGWAGIQSRESAAEYDPEALHRMDYFVAKLKAAGVFVELSTAFGPVNPGPADVRDIPYLAEFGGSGRNPMDGYFTMDTAGTKAVVGFAEGRTCWLGDVTVTPRSHFAAIYVTASEPDRNLAESKRLLVVAIARARNTDMKWVGKRRMVAVGREPILMEPVVADVVLAKTGTPTVRILDHDGHRTGRTVSVRGGAFQINGAIHRTPYYEIVYE